MLFVLTDCLLKITIGFIHGRHPIEKRVIKDGIEYCKDVFDKFVVADQSITLGERIIRSYSPARRHQRRIVLNVYCAENDDVQVISKEGTLTKRT